MFCGILGRFSSFSFLKKYQVSFPLELNISNQTLIDIFAFYLFPDWIASTFRLQLRVFFLNVDLSVEWCIGSPISGISHPNQQSMIDKNRKKFNPSVTHSIFYVPLGVILFTLYVLKLNNNNIERIAQFVVSMYVLLFFSLFVVFSLI